MENAAAVRGYGVTAGCGAALHGSSILALRARGVVKAALLGLGPVANVEKNRSGARSFYAPIDRSPRFSFISHSEDAGHSDSGSPGPCLRTY